MRSTADTQTDVALVGAGPIGIELAVAFKRAGVDYVHFDAKQVGYTFSWWAPQTRFFSSNERIAIAGVPLYTVDQTKCTREEYLTYLRSIVTQFNLNVRTYEPVVGIERDDDGFVVTTHPRGGERVCHATRVVLVTGGTDRPRKLDIPGENLPHVAHYFKDPHTYFGQRLLVVGGKNSAVETALRCHHAGAKVALSYRRSTLPESSIKYWLLPEINWLIKEKRIEAFFDSVPLSISENEVTLSVKAADGSSKTVIVPADFVLSQIGFEQDNTLFKIAGIELLGDCGVPAHDPRTMESNVKNLYVAGTAVGGTQDKYSVFLENCHVHVRRILRAITGIEGGPVDEDRVSPEILAQPES